MGNVGVLCCSCNCCIVINWGIGELVEFEMVWCCEIGKWY